MKLARIAPPGYCVSHVRSAIVSLAGEASLRRNVVAERLSGPPKPRRDEERHTDALSVPGAAIEAREVGIWRSSGMLGLTAKAVVDSPRGSTPITTLLPGLCFQLLIPDYVRGVRGTGFDVSPSEPRAKSAVFAALEMAKLPEVTG